MSEGVSVVAFGLLAAAAVLGAVMTLLTRNVVRAGFWLFEMLVASAGSSLLLSAEFLALVQLMVCAGATSLSVLLAITLTLKRDEDAWTPRESPSPVLGMSLAFGVFAVVALLKADLPAPPLSESVPGVAELGRIVFSDWVLPVVIVPLVLLVALVGAVWWSGEDGR